jgi:hypothetical protein
MPHTKSLFYKLKRPNIINGVKKRRNTTKAILAKMSSYMYYMFRPSIAAIIRLQNIAYKRYTKYIKCRLMMRSRTSNRYKLD